MPSSRDRELLRRFYLNDESRDRICQDLELTSEHFNRVIFRARNRFRELLERRGWVLNEARRMPSETTVFISYDCRSRSMLDEFHLHLAELRREGVITTWVDREISVGTPRGREVGPELEKASLFVPLVSSELLNSKYCYDLEMTRAMTLHEAGQINIAPVILEDCGWRSSPFGRFKPLPDGRPIGAWLNEGAAFQEVIGGLRTRLRCLKAA
jgi:hypothetical protein